MKQIETVYNIFLLTIKLTEKINLILIEFRRRVTIAKHQSKVNERK